MKGKHYKGRGGGEEGKEGEGEGKGRERSRGYSPQIWNSVLAPDNNPCIRLTVRNDLLGRAPLKFVALFKKNSASEFEPELRIVGETKMECNKKKCLVTAKFINILRVKIL
jgi:hypothetical protein